MSAFVSNVKVIKERMVLIGDHSTSAAAQEYYELKQELKFYEKCVKELEEELAEAILLGIE